MILIDANVIEDVLEKRRGWKASLAMLTLARQDKVKGYISALTPPILYFLQNKPDDIARTNVLTAIRNLTIVDLTAGIIAAAFAEKRLGDFEDAIQFHSAKGSNLQTVVTRNQRHFKGVKKEIAIQSPEEFLLEHARQQEVDDKA